MRFPTLIMLCGIPGGGKSTYSHQYLKDHPDIVIISSDSIRKEFYGDEAILGDRHEVFTLMVNRTLDHLSKGESVLYDSTALTRKSRRKILSACPVYVRKECHIIWAPPEVCIARDAGRTRTVGPKVIEELIQMFEAPFYDEGFDVIRFILPKDFDPAAYAKMRCLSQCTGPDSDFAASCIAAGIGPWDAVGLPGASPDGVWLIDAHAAARAQSGYYHQLPVFLREMVKELSGQ